VARGLATSRDHARALVLAGRVLVAGAPAAKPDRQVSPAEPLVVQGPPPRYVGRGALKLEAALERFAIVVSGLRAIDVGASTGGFTDCLLQHGATGVVAIDVGYGQLHEKLRADPRVRNVERCNVRSVDAADVGGPAPLVVVDVSFISLITIAPALVGLLEPEGDLLALVKPQFEAGRQEVSKGSGVVRDPAVWGRVLGEVRSGLAAVGAVMMEAMVSPITGASGNVEFLVRARRTADGAPVVADAARDEACDAVLDAAVAEAVALVAGGRRP
jgi:23S rRNA (cytidine1920-2'-O)/16S rRNA (cytidine1409-2'-O)-methyltransferase